jgi:hypothetical protein
MAKQFSVKELVGSDEQGRPVHREVTIPDGKWVLWVSTRSEGSDNYDFESEDVWSETREDWYLVVGPAPGTRYTLDRSRYSRFWDYGGAYSRSSHYCLVGDEPFGAIIEVKEDGQRAGGLWFSCARQIHKGELGRRPQIVRPQFARQAPPDMAEVSPLTERAIKARDRKRGKHGWAQLIELAGLVRMDPEELVRRYFDFADAKYGALQVLFAERREQIHGQRVEWNSWQKFREEDLPRLFDRDPSTIWVRQGFSLAVLYLQAFGHIPSLPQEAAKAEAAA